MSKTLLLISDLPQDQAFAAAAADGAGLQLKLAPNPRDGVKLISQGEVAATFVDVSTKAKHMAFEAAVQDTIGLFSELVNSNQIHMLSSDDIEKVEFLIQSPLFGNFVLRNYGDAKQAGQHYGRHLKFCLGARAFGLGALFGPSVKIQTVKLKNSNQKQEAVEAVRNFALQAKFQSRMASVIANAVDELVMNAIFDAPVSELGKPLFDSTLRNTAFPLQGKHEVEMKVCFDGTYLAITAIDLFGSIDKAKLLKHISKIYNDEEYKVRTTYAGGGIGLSSVFRSGGTLFFSSEAQSRTEATVLYHKSDNFRDFREQFRFLSTQFYF